MSNREGKGSIGTFAFDIDGTCTNRSGELLPDLLTCFSRLFHEKWQLLFVTGRTFAWSYELLHVLPVPYIVASLNGAEAFSLPDKHMLYTTYVPDVAVREIVNLYDAPLLIYSRDAILYANFDGMPQLTLHPLTLHLERRRLRQRESWNRLVGEPQDVLAVRYFFESSHVPEQLPISDAWDVARMQDSFNSNVTIVQITAKGVNKGIPLARLGLSRPLIAFGDDYNDIPLFMQADSSYCNEMAPDVVKQAAQHTFNPNTLAQVVMEAHSSYEIS